MIYSNTRKPHTEADEPSGHMPEDPQAERFLKLAHRVAQTTSTVLLLGESGTGKSRLAKEIHQIGPLSDQPFVTVNCPCLGRDLLESELFGHRKGSFTGAVNDTWGKVAAAEGGTLFLDEIGDMPLSIQPKLLRLLQDREYERVGDPKVHRARVRIIAATNSDLRKSVLEGRFREDLYYRLNVFSIEIPALRERMGDFVRFANELLADVLAKTRRNLRGFTPEALEAMQNYSWPGNVRELWNAIEYAAIMGDSPSIRLQDLPESVIKGNTRTSTLTVGAPISLEELEAHHIRTVISNTKSLAEAARILDIDPTTLYRKRKRWDQAGFAAAA